MKDNVTKMKRIKNIVFTFLGIILLFSCVSLAIYDYALEQKAVNVSAMIVSIDYDDGGNKAIVRYKVEDKNYEQKIKLPINSKLSVKDQTKIKYDINNPNKLISNNHEILIAAFVLLGIFSLLIGLPKFVSDLKRNIRINNLYKKGIYVNAMITDIFVNNNGKKAKGMKPYKLRCKYLNPANNQEYVFESEDYYVDLSSVVNKYNAKGVVVLIDKNNSGNYYVDLDSIVPKIKLVDPMNFTMKEKK